MWIGLNELLRFHLTLIFGKQIVLDQSHSLTYSSCLLTIIGLMKMQRSQESGNNRDISEPKKRFGLWILKWLVNWH